MSVRWSKHFPNIEFVVYGKKSSMYSSHSLVPRPPPFLPSVFFHYNTREQKTSEKWGRPRSIHHVSGCEVDVGRRGRYSNMYILNLKASFLLVKMSSFDHAEVWSPKLR